ncbi:hypothetical protein N7520_006397 [Penicillium odoratum]|uniref:uncharacterized protein n=1 Tax=Penicillium odoratum TaxID=1167516 RepID=UPI002548CCD5|nr:uncharacterized protein N7520_006397 [Penicillium odoratum]KAJ5759241.1 hypothetical protein N7520_006397 [Penicillium odoratum]
MDDHSLNSGSLQPARAGFERSAHEPTDTHPRETPRRARPPPLRALYHQTQQSLPRLDAPNQPIGQHPRFLIAHASQRSGNGSETLPRQTTHVRAFSQPQSPTYCASPTGALTPRISITTDDLFGETPLSSPSHIPDIPPFPPSFQNPPLPQHDHYLRSADLIAPLSTHRSLKPHSPAVSETIPNNRYTMGSIASSQAIPSNRYTLGSIASSQAIPNNRQTLGSIASSQAIPNNRQTLGSIASSQAIPNNRQTLGSLASSQAIPSSWEFEPAESGIFGANLDAEWEGNQYALQNDRTFRRSTIFGKKNNPAMRTNSKSNLISSESSPTIIPPPLAILRSNQHSRDSIDFYSKSQSRRGSASTTGSESVKSIDPEKSHIVHQFSHHNEQLDLECLEKEPEALPQSVPTSSLKKFNCSKPLSPDIGAIRDTEPRISHASLSSLIRRAVKMATSPRMASIPDESRANSRADLLGNHCNDSVSEIIDSFPTPGLSTQNENKHWTALFGRSNLRFVENINTEEKTPHATSPTTHYRSLRRCCGLSPTMFTILCIVIVLVILSAILLPVLLIHHSKALSSSCAKTTPCYNGGVSVSIGSSCSCVCGNGFTGSNCTTNGDSNCITSDVTSNNNATMGSSLQTLFADSATKFSINLEPDTILALFSSNNASCTTENALVSFSGVPTSSGTGDTFTTRSAATKNGILYDDSNASKTAAKASRENDTIVPSKVLEFSKVAVLYILEQTGSFTNADYTRRAIFSYMVHDYNSTVHNSMQVLGNYELDFENESITLPNGTMIGG